MRGSIRRIFREAFTPIVKSTRALPRRERAVIREPREAAGVGDVVAYRDLDAELGSGLAHGGLAMEHLRAHRVA